MANNWNLGLVGKLDGTKSKNQINQDIQALQKVLNDVELRAKLDPNQVKSLENQLSKLQVSLTDVTIPQSVLNNLVNQVNNALQGISININVNTNTGGNGNLRDVISNDLKNAIKDVTSPELEVGFHVDPADSGKFEKEVSKIITDLQKKDATAISYRLNTYTETDDNGDSIEHLRNATFQYTTTTGEAIRKTIEFNEAQKTWVESSASYSKTLDTISAKTDTFIDKRKKAVSDFEIDLQKIQARVADQGVGKPIKDQVHLDSLEAQYDEVNDAIRRLDTSTKDTFTDTKIEVEKAIAVLENLERTYRNAETVATSLRAKDIPTVKSQYSSNLDVLIERMQSSGVYSSGFQKGAESLRNILNNITDSSDVNDLRKFLNGLDKLESGYKRAKASADAFNQSQKVGIKVSGLEASISDLQKISPEINSFETEINGAKITIQSLGDDLSKVVTQSDFSVVNEKWRAFTKSAEASGIAIRDFGNITDSIAKKISGIKHSLSVGDYDTQLKSYTIALQKAGIEGQELATKIDGAKIALEELRKSATADNIIPSDVDEKFTKLRTEFEKLANDVKNVKLDNSLFADDIKVNDTITRLNEQLRKNGAYSTSAKIKIQEWIKELEKGNVAESRLKAINSEAKELHSNMAKLGNIGKSRWQTFTEYVRSFSEWMISSGAVLEVVQGVKTATNNVIKLSNSLLELSKVSDLSEGGLLKVTERAYELSKTVGKTGTQVLDAVTEFKRAGYDMDKSFNMAEAAMVMTNVAENIKETSDAAGTLISVLKGFNMAETDAMKIVDMINSTSNQSPIGFDQLAEGLERTAGTLAQSGNSIQQTIGLLTAGYAQLRNVEKVSQGLITISARIRGVGEDGETIDGLASKMSEDFGKIGVAVENADGSLRSIYQIAQDYSKVLPNLTDKQKQYYAELAAGKHQVTVWNAIVKQFEDAEKATAQAIDSVGSASEENQKYLENISGKISIFQSVIEKLSNTILNSKILSFFVDLGTVGVDSLTNLIEKSRELISGFELIGTALGTFIQSKSKSGGLMSC